MDSQRSYEALFSTETDVSNSGARESALWRTLRYAACVALGLLGGAMGVALAIGLAILIQLALPPHAVFAPGIVPLMVTAVLAGLGVSWLLNRLGRHSWPSLFDVSSERGLQVMLVSSVFASLLQTLIFFM